MQARGSACAHPPNAHMQTMLPLASPHPPRHLARAKHAEYIPASLSQPLTVLSPSQPPTPPLTRPPRSRALSPPHPSPHAPPLARSYRVRIASLSRAALASPGGKFPRS